MRIYLKSNVLEEARRRFRWLFSEFDNVVVSVSGGKDSTVCFHIALEVARELGRLPLKVLFLDQEAEWDATIEQIRYCMYHPDVDPLWFQIPFDLFNATSKDEHWLRVWSPEDEGRWVRPKDPISIKENTFGERRFTKLLNFGIPKALWPDERVAMVVGMRAEESPTRTMGITNSLCYKDVTWGRVLNSNRGHYNFFPIYDWSYLDVWKTIHDNRWPYCSIYDAMFQYGISVNNMRVSNVHHETAVQSLFFMQELEPSTYERLVNRIKGIHSAGKLTTDGFMPKELPPMFSGWSEYRDYLLDNLITVPEWREKMGRAFAKQEAELGEALGDALSKVHISSILTNDWELIKTRNYLYSSPKAIDARMAGRRQRKAERDGKECDRPFGSSGRQGSVGSH